MKKYSVILLLIFQTAIIYSQNKGDNVIIIENFKGTADFSDIKRILITNGYELFKFDTSEEYFSTEFHPVEGSVYAYNLKIKFVALCFLAKTSNH